MSARVAVVAILLAITLSLSAQSAPSISSLSPSIGPASPVGGPVNIRGAGFGAAQGDSSVTFAGIAASVSSWSDTSIVAAVPVNAPVGFDDLVVTVNGVASNAQSFLLFPTITNDLPAQGSIGTAVTITGTSFGAQQGSSTLTFNGVPATPTTWSNTSIKAPVPPGASDGSIVATINGFATNGLYFYVVPAISGIQPGTAAVGSQVTISGSGFGAAQGFGGVTFNGVSAIVQSWSGSSIKVTVPSGATTGPVVVTDASLLSGNSMNFTVQSSGLITPRYMHSATLLNSGKILVAGGISCPTAGNCTYLNSAEIYDPVAETSTATGSMSVARSTPGVLLADGRVLLAGGLSCDSNGNCSSLNTAEVYDPTTGTFSVVANMVASRTGHTVTVLKNGQVLIAAGETCISSTSCSALNTAELFDPVAGTLSAAAVIGAQARFDAAATLLDDGTVLLVGGFDGTNFNPFGKVYSPDFFSGTANNLNVLRYRSSASLLNTSQALIAGGSTCASPDCPSGVAELYNPSTRSFTLANSNLNQPRFSHTATELSNGQVLFAGGYGSCEPSCTAISSTELYDPVSGLFSSSQVLASSRAGHTATLLPDGRVLVLGGSSSGITLGSVEFYQPTSLVPPSLTAIAVTPVGRSFLPGSVLALTATGTFSDGSTQILASVNWSSSDTTVAQVTNDATDQGLAYAIANGSVTMNACAGSVCGSTMLVVGPPTITAITVTPSSAITPAGIQQQFFAIASLSDATTKDVSSSVTWISSAPQVSTINSIGVAATLSAGTANVQATLSTLSSSATLNVQPPLLLAISVEPALGGTQLGGSQQFTAIGSFSDGTTANLTASASWSSSNSAISTVNASGLATGTATGSTIITASVGGAQASASLNVTAGTSPPTITASISPAPNASGWNNSNVTVTFNCAAGSSPVVNCPAAQTVSTDGAGQSVSGTVTDAAGGSATTAVTLNVDKTVPAITISSPSDGTGFANANIQVSGSIADSLSGVSALSCNGVPAVITGGAFACDVSLAPGVNVVLLRGSDVAGNLAAENVHVSLSVPLPAPVSLAISPANVSMLVDGEQSFTAVDELGRIRNDVTWSVSDSTIATLAADGPGTLDAIAPGTTTLTATVQSTSSQITVNVFSGTSLPPGTINWSVRAAPASTVARVIQATPSSGGPDLYSIESINTSSGVIRALAANGQQLWAQPVNGDMTTLHLTPDGDGGVLLDFRAAKQIIDLDGQTGMPIWEYDSPSDTTEGPGDVTRELSVGPDSTIYFREQRWIRDPVFLTLSQIWSLVALNGDTGLPITRYQLPASNMTILSGCDGVSAQQIVPINGTDVSNPVVGLDGVAVFNSVVYNRVFVRTPLCGGTFIEEINPGVTLSLVRLSADGSTSSAPYQTISALRSGGADAPAFPAGLIPDGQGGILASWYLPIETGVSGEVHITHVSGSGASDSVVPLQVPQAFTPAQPASMVLGENGNFFATDGLTVAGLNQSLQLLWTWTSAQNHTLDLVVALEGGGVALNDTDMGSSSVQIIRFDVNGNISPDGWNSTGLSPDFLSGSDTWEGSPDGQSIAKLQELYAAVPAETDWAFIGGNPAGSAGAVAFISNGMPFWGNEITKKAKPPKCVTVATALKAPLAGNPLARYNDKKQKLLDGGFLTSTTCQTFFNTNSSLSRVFNSLTGGVTNQQVYDGSHSSITMYDAGIWVSEDFDIYGINTYKTGQLSCRLSEGVNDNPPNGIIADSQLQPPATDMYLNTFNYKLLTQGVILHETLHNLTMLNDHVLKLLLGLDTMFGRVATDDITHKLEAKGCAGTK